MAWMESLQIWLVDERAWLIPLTGVIAAISVFFNWLYAPFNRTTTLSRKTIEALKPGASGLAALSVGEFIDMRRALKADLEEELARATAAEKSQLMARIAMLESQISNPGAALEEAQMRIAELERLLDRASNEIGTERIEEAKSALERGDYTAADAIFAELEAQNDLAVSAAARAIYGRGEVAESDVRWADAAQFYRRAAQLDPSYRTLTKAHEFTHWTGDYARARGIGFELIEAAEREGDQPNLAMAKNDVAMTLRALGAYEESEALYRAALAIDRATIGEAHPDYAVHLNNYAVVVKAQGRFEEAERLYREALEVGKATKGTDHAQYAKHLNNLATVIEAQGRYSEAEGLLREALEVDRKTIGTSHPHYATHLKNLAGVLATLAKVDEARGLYEEALAVFSKSLPAQHHYITEVKEGLAKLPSPTPA